jgi:hypothetical protein
MNKFWIWRTLRYCIPPIQIWRQGRPGSPADRYGRQQTPVSNPLSLPMRRLSGDILVPSNGRANDVLGKRHRANSSAPRYW